MKKSILIFVGVILLASCGPNNQELKANCESLLENKAFNDYYGEAYVGGWRTTVESCGEANCLQDCYDKLLDKVAEAEAEIMIKNAVENAENGAQ